nr:ATP-dependent peptidase [Tanacetum cinerariifolium]
MEKRVSTVAKLGYKTCVVPKLAEKVLHGLDFGDLEVLGCNNLKE